MSSFCVLGFTSRNYKTNIILKKTLTKQAEIFYAFKCITNFCLQVIANKVLF